MSEESTRGSGLAGIKSLSGQALIELMAGLIVIMVLLSGFALVAVLTDAHNKTIVSAQLGVSESAMMDEYDPVFDSVYLSGWGTGPDNKSYTRDDVPVWPADPGEYVDRITRYAHPENLNAILPDNPVSQIAANEELARQFRLVTGYSLQTVPALPVVRHLFYDRSSISVRSQLWMTWLKDLY